MKRQSLVSAYDIRCHKPLNISCVLKEAVLDKLFEKRPNESEISSVSGCFACTEPIKQKILQSCTRDFVACRAFAILTEKGHDSNGGSMKTSYRSWQGRLNSPQNRLHL